MPNENDSNRTSSDSETQPSMQTPVPPTAPEQDKMRCDAKNGPNHEDSKAIKIEEDIRSGERWLIGISATGVILNVVIALIYYGQLVQMREATSAAQKAAEIADATLKDNQKSFVLNERPYLIIEGAPQFIKPPAVDTPIQANVVLRNIGKTPALKILWNVRLLTFIPGKKDSAGYQRLVAFMTSTFDDLAKKDTLGRNEIIEKQAEHDVAPEATLFSTSQDILKLSAHELNTLQTSDSLTLFYVGMISYTDNFGGVYKTEFCWIYWGSDPRTWHICDNHNVIE
jgi:hypothetical protein